MAITTNPFEPLGQYTGVYVGGGGGGSGATGGGTAQSHAQKIHQPFDPTNPAWGASISTLVDTWLARFGDNWVDGSELEGDTFFSIAATRLIQINRLEKHSVPNKFQVVYRIVE